MLAQIILLTIFGSILSLSGGLLLLLKKTWNHKFSLFLTSFAAGVLLSTAFLDLFPESLKKLTETGDGDIFVPALLGIVTFFLLERTLIWFHHHDDSHGVKPTVWMVTIGDGVHNFIDGVAIAATYIANPALGLTTAIAVAAHEIPQEIADFSIYLSHGLSHKRAIIFNVGSALTAIVGAMGMYYFSGALENYLGHITAFTAGMFCYIALSDLIPELHHAQNKQDTLPQIVAFIIGIGLMMIVRNFLGE